MKNELDANKLKQAIENLSIELAKGTDTISCLTRSEVKWTLFVRAYYKEASVKGARSIHVIEYGDSVLQNLTDREMLEIASFVSRTCAKHKFKPSKAYKRRNEPCLEYYCKPIWSEYRK